MKHIIDLSERIECLIFLLQTHHDEVGELDTTKYRDLWPKTVETPADYVGRFDIPLLVDLSLDPRVMFRLAGYQIGFFSVWPEESIDLVERPKHPKSGAPLVRYIAWCRVKQSPHNVEEPENVYLASDEVGMVTSEGMFLPQQCTKELNQSLYNSTFLLGSRHRVPFIFPEKIGVTEVLRWDYERYSLNVYMRYINKWWEDSSVASRGREVIPVSW